MKTFEVLYNSTQQSAVRVKAKSIDEAYHIIEDIIKKDPCSLDRSIRRFIMNVACVKEVADKEYIDTYSSQVVYEKE